MRILISIVLFIAVNTTVYSQVRLALTNKQTTIPYMTALIYDIMIKLKGDDWVVQNIITPLSEKQYKKFRNRCEVYADGIICFYPINTKSSPEFIQALNEVALYLEKHHAVIYREFDLYSLSDINNVKYYAVPYYRDFLLREKERIATESIQSSLIHRMVPVFSGYTNCTPIEFIWHYQDLPEIEKSKLTIIDYLKQEFDKILSQPIKSTLDYGITNEDFWSNNNTTENDSENTIKD